MSTDTNMLNFQYGTKRSRPRQVKAIRTEN